MRSMIRATAIALVLSVVAGALQAQGGAAAPTKIGFVNTAVVMDAAPGKDSAAAMLTREGDVFQKTLQKMQDSINFLLAKYQKDEPTMTAVKKDAAQKAMQALETDFQAKNLQFQQQFQARQAEVMAPIQDIVKKVIDDIRVEDGYAIILDRTPNQTSIISADKNLDITDRVVSRLRATAKPVLPAAKAGAPGAPAGVTRPPTRPPPGE